MLLVLKESNFPEKVRHVTCDEVKCQMVFGRGKKEEGRVSPRGDPR